MAGPNGDIRDALMAAAGAQGPGPGGPADDAADAKEGDMRCPTCGASCQKIEAAAGGGKPPSPMMGMGM